MDNCLFCRIIREEIPSRKEYEDEHCFAFWDINPQAPVHVLVVPKRHLQSLDDQPGDVGELYAHLMKAVKAVAGQCGIAQSGYRLVSNCGADACQSVPHLHFHVLGGAKMTEKMA